MTLIEILIAAGILALGMVGILSLFLLAIHNVSTAVSRTVGASVARQAAVSLEHYSLDLAALDTPAVASVGGIDLDGSGANVCGAISTVANVGDGWADPCFRLPEGCILPDALKGDAAGNCVKVRWNPDYGWTATFLPIDAGDPVVITDRTRYCVQIAIWRHHKLFSEEVIGTGPGSPPTGAFTSGSPVVVIGNESPEFWTRVKPGDYIRHADVGVWYQIAELNEPDPGDVTLSGNFWHPVPGPLSGAVEVASRLRLIGLYDAALRPPGQ